MTDPITERASMGDVLDTLVASMTAAQFDELAQRTGHKSSQEQAAEALSQFRRQQNLAAGDASLQTVAAALNRKGRR